LCVLQPEKTHRRGTANRKTTCNHPNPTVLSWERTRVTHKNKIRVRKEVGEEPIVKRKSVSSVRGLKNTAKSLRSPHRGQRDKHEKNQKKEKKILPSMGNN